MFTGVPCLIVSPNRLKILPKHIAVRQDLPLQVRGAVGEEEEKMTRSPEQDHTTHTAAEHSHVCTL